MNSSLQRMEDALLNVRKAYRLLHDYQRMVMDAADFIGETLGLTYINRWPKFSNDTAREGRGTLGLSAWDQLGMVQCEFHFNRKLGNCKTLWMSMLLISDTGYFCSTSDDLEKSDVCAFLPPEQSQTKVGFIISGSDWLDPKFLSTREDMKTFIETDGQLPADYAVKGSVAKCCDLTHLISEESTGMLIEELIRLANNAGIPLKRVAL